MSLAAVCTVLMFTCLSLLSSIECLAVPVPPFAGVLPGPPPLAADAFPVNPVETVVEYRPLGYAPFVFPYQGPHYYSYSYYNAPFARFGLPFGGGPLTLQPAPAPSPVFGGPGPLPAPGAFWAGFRPFADKAKEKVAAVKDKALVKH